MKFSQQKKRFTKVPNFWKKIAILISFLQNKHFIRVFISVTLLRAVLVRDPFLFNNFYQ